MMLQQSRFFLFVFFCFSTFLSANPPKTIFTLPTARLLLVTPAPPSVQDQQVVLTGGKTTVLLTLRASLNGLFTGYLFRPSKILQVEFLDQKVAGGALEIIQWVGKHDLTVLNQALNPITGNDRFEESREQRYIKCTVPVFSEGRPFHNKVWIRVLYEVHFGIVNPSVKQFYRSHIAYDYSR